MNLNNMIKQMPLLLIILSILVVSIQGTVGLKSYPFTTSIPTSTMQCIKQGGYNDLALTIQSSHLQIRREYIQNVVNANNVGLNTSAIVFNPCSVRSQEEQVKEFGQKISKDLYGRVWIQIATNIYDATCSWNIATRDDQALMNCAKMTNLLREFKKLGIKTGIKIYNCDYPKYFMNYCQEMSSQPLFWVYPDKNPSFSGFQPFAGWNAPVMKLHIMVEHYCGLLVDYFYYP